MHCVCTRTPKSLLASPTTGFLENIWDYLYSIFLLHLSTGTFCLPDLQRLEALCGMLDQPTKTIKRKNDDRLFITTFRTT
jgi:hypothetical protein